MDINQFNRVIRQEVNDQNAAAWLAAPDRKQFCRDLLGAMEVHEIVINILVDVLDELLQRRAEDKFANYNIGDGVTILENGRSLPATIIRNSPREEILTVQRDRILPSGSIVPDQSGEVLDFHRSHDKVYIHMEGRSLSRLVTGRCYHDYSTEHLDEEYQRHHGNFSQAI
ncbi:hypothetical protein [Neptuniibacter halophilus]|uniref:hypothetical protein n=1 Tax=Neptuniibacter halophilus TaxID=651666 RepID=UPI002572477B|nr:hypothetical protein [Neptuniibacter halophilus]